MRKALPILLLIITIAGGVWWYKSAQTKPLVSVAPARTFKKACDVFTLADATAVLGEGATQTPTHSDTISAQKSVTTCLYSYDPGSLSDIVSASMLLQGAPAGQTQQSFTQARPANAETIKDYGDQAFWDPSLGQLNILKGSYWVIISAGSGPLNQRQPDLPRRIADIIMKRI
jgi:hypothetical protein